LDFGLITYEKVVVGLTNKVIYRSIIQ